MHTCIPGSFGIIIVVACQQMTKDQLWNKDFVLLVPRSKIASQIYLFLCHAHAISTLHITQVTAAESECPCRRSRHEFFLAIGPKYQLQHVLRQSRFMHCSILLLPWPHGNWEGRRIKSKQMWVRPSATGQHGQPLDLSMSTLMTWIIVKGSSFISQKLLLPKHVVFIGIGSKTAPSFSDLVGDCRQHSQGSRQRLCRELARS